jgi:predicted ATP-dependent endonuclease of OLD family
MFQSIGIKNWRSIGNKESLIRLGQVTILVGANDTGKSSYLLAGFSILSFLSKENDQYIEQILNMEGSVHENEYGEVSGEIEFSLIAALDGDLIKEFSKITFTGLGSRITNQIINNKYPLTEFELRNKNWTDKFYEVEQFLDSVKKVIKVKYVYRPLHPDNSMVSELISTELMKKISEYLVDNNAYEEESFTEIGNFVREEFSKVNISYTTVSTSFFITTNREYNLNRFNTVQSSDDIQLKLGHDPSELIRFIQFITSEKLRRQGKYRKLIEYVRILFPEITEIETGIIENKYSKIDVFIKWDKNGVVKRQPLSRSGSGVINSLYLVAKLLLGQNKSAIGFIDEPETGLHPRLQVRFIKLLRLLSNDFHIQWVIATHSPFFMKNIKENDVLYLSEHNGKESTLRLIEPSDKSAVFNAIGAYLPDTLISKGIIFVEGATEAAILPILLSNIGIDLEKEEIVILPLGGENLFGINPLDFTKIHEKIIIILDSDLKKPVTNGGIITKKKTDYEKQCISNGIKVFLSRDYRCIENIYPKETLAQVLNISLGQLTSGLFDIIPQIPDGKKVSIGIEVAKAFPIEKIRELALIKSIIEWID